ncbi:hypothetical protein [Streptomyces cucumeris]|uniref:P-type ATPase n=1 Tax=Streptomyces cucumeris TaxID=2962890 RepID=UPI003D7115FF
MGELVPGDVVRHGPGDLVPADVRLPRSHGLSVHQDPLTGRTPPAPRAGPCGSSGARPGR